MAWNQPGEDKKRPAPRGAPDNSSLDELLQRWQQRVQRLWRPGRGGGSAAIALLLLAAAVWLASGYYQIEVSERGVVQRFGRFVSIEQPGHGWRWPWPIETMTKVNIANNASVESKSLMLSSDQNLIAISWSVQYRINDPLQYLFSLRDPETILRLTSESEIREQVAASPVLGVLAGDARARITSQAREKIQQTLDRYRAGISLSSVNLTDVELPDAVLAAQHDAEKARDERQRAVADAQAYANDIVPKGQSQVQRQLADAQLYASQTVANAQGEAERFSQLVNAYTLSPEVMRNRLYIDTMESILSSSRKIVIDVKNGAGNMIYLPLDKLAEAVRFSSTAGAAATSTAGAVAAAAPAAAAPTAAGAVQPAAPTNTGSVDQEDRGRDRGER